MMKVIHGFGEKRYSRLFLAIGVFDGVHRAHLKILRETVRLAGKRRGVPAVMTFWPHPQKERLVYSLPHRLRAIADTGVKVCFLVKFNSSFSSLSPEEFARRILSVSLGVSEVLVGENFRFGKGMKGTVRALRKLGGENGFRANVFKTVESGGRPVSSTRLRRLIAAGDLEGARLLLGRRVSVLGRVTRGSAFGRRLGYPTANLAVSHEVIPPPGIYAVVAALGGRSYPAVCYIGSRPTLAAGSAIEVHIFDFNRNLYGKTIEVKFVRFIRNEKKFSSPELLVLQIAKDCARARSVLAPFSRRSY